MRYLFKQSVSINKKDYTQGTREVPAEVEKHAHFLGYLAAGYIVPCADPSEVISNASMQARNKALSALLKSRKAKPSAECGVVKDEAPVDVVAEVEVKAEASIEPEPENVSDEGAEKLDAADAEAEPKKKRNRK